MIISVLMTSFYFLDYALSPCNDDEDLWSVNMSIMQGSGGGGGGGQNISALHSLKLV